MIKLNNYEVKATIFPDGTSQVWKLPEEFLSHDIKLHRIYWEFQSESEIFHIMQLNTLLKYARIPCDITLEMPYLPYARQDKNISNNTTFALHTFASIINSMRFTKVIVKDAHSSVACGLINNLVDLFPLNEILDTIGCCDSDAIALPDKGAYDRYSKEFKDIHTIIGHKARDQVTGYIKEYSFEGDPKGKSILIIDDICDGGMTFRLLARDLLKVGALEVNLYVTHGIFSKGIDVLKKDGINRIFTHKGEIR